MEKFDPSVDALFETLTIERREVPGMSPPFQGYGPRPDYWSWWQYPAKNGGIDIEYRNSEGNKHRIYGPAYVSKKYKTEEWYKNGMRHRENGPAFIHNNNRVWFYEDKLHRLDGPAVVELGGPKQYWIHGQRMSKKEYEKEIIRRKRKGLIK